MDNMEENSRSTEQDRVANPVEKTVYYTKGYELAGSNYYDIDNIEGLKLEQ